MKGLRRTHYCGEVPETEQEVVVCGFADRVRDMGNLIFINLRDRTGLVQLAFNDETDRAVFEKAQLVKSEYVLMAKGMVRPRESVNEKLKTGKIEAAATDLENQKVQETPFEVINSDKVNDELKLKYRYLDLRNPKLQKNIITRHKIAQITREYFYDNGFLEIETPMMMKSTPEGKRLPQVPSRVYAGKFYALSTVTADIYKQLLMISGYDRYIQLARCFRDEDLRADRQPEFTQIDLEMSFVDQEDIQACIEGYIEKLFKEIPGV